MTNASGIADMNITYYHYFLAWLPQLTMRERYTVFHGLYMHITFTLCNLTKDWGTSILVLVIILYIHLICFCLVQQVWVCEVLKKFCLDVIKCWYFWACIVFYRWLVGFLLMLESISCMQIVLLNNTYVNEMQTSLKFTWKHY